MRLIDTGSSGSGFSYYGLMLLCPQKFAFRYRPLGGGKIAVPSEDTAIDQETVPLPQRKGSCLHGALAHHYAVMMGETDVYAPHEALKLLCEKYKLDAETTSALREIYDSYARTYQYDPWEPIFVEKLFEIKVGGYLYTMRVDLGVKYKGKVFFVDHKSSFRVSDSTSTRYTLSGQFVAGEQIGLKSYGSDFGGMYINLLPSRVDTNLKNQFKRVRLPPIPGMSKEVFKRTIVHAAELVKKYDEAQTSVLDYPRVMNESVCMTAYGPCPYFERCQWECGSTTNFGVIP